MNTQLKSAFFVGIGGMIGAVSRYSISVLMNSENLFPWATLSVNLSGSFLLGFLLFSRFFRDKLSEQLLTALTVGVIGSFTTFSAVTYEAIELWQVNPLFSLGYIFISVLGSLTFCYVAFIITKRWQVEK